MRLWKLVKSIKMDALKRCEHDGWWTTFDDDGEIDGEGYVMWNRWGIYKLVNRNQFSRLNFFTGIIGSVHKVSHTYCKGYQMDYNKYITKKPL